LPFPSKHYDRDICTYETEGENAVGTTAVTFTIGVDGKATTAVVENLNARGEGRSNERPPTAGSENSHPVRVSQFAPVLRR
jgi:hypothetical protein